MTDRPASVLTVQSEAPPPYSEYDDTSPAVPEPNAETQAMLRGGYLIHNNQRTPQQSLQDASPAAVYIRDRRYTGRHDDLITIARAINPTVKVEGIPFPNEYPTVSSRDVKPEDWKLFATLIVDELEVPAPKGSVPTPLSLNEFRERQDTIDAVVEQWNTGFFGPRGIHVVPAYSYGRRVPSPTPTYRTLQTDVSESAEIETVTFDTSPRSTRAPTPDTIREFELEQNNIGGRTTPKAERASFVPTITGPTDETAHQQASFEKEFQEQLQIDEQTQRLVGAGLLAGPTQAKQPVGPDHGKAKAKLRRFSDSSSSSSISLSSIDTLSSSDDIALGDVPAIRRTLAEEFHRDPNDMSHLKAALAQIRNDVKSQQATMSNATDKLQKKSMHTASKEHRKAMRAEMKELRREIKSYHKIVKIHKKDERDAKRQQRKQQRSDFKESRKEHRHNRKADRKSRKRGVKNTASQLSLIPERGTDTVNQSWRDAGLGPSSAWPFGKKGSGLPEEEIPPEVEKGWPWGGDMAGWPWDDKFGAQRSQYPANWPLNAKPPGWPARPQHNRHPLEQQNPGQLLGERAPGWPLNKSQSAPVARKPVPPRRPGTSPSPTPPAPVETGSPGPSNAPTSPEQHASHGTHLSPSASFPAASAARAASRSPSPGPAAPQAHSFSPQHFSPWSHAHAHAHAHAHGRGRGFRPGADWTGGRGRRFGERPGVNENASLGFGRGMRDRSHSDDGRGRGRGFGRGGRAGSDDAGLIGMARNFLVQQAQDGLERLRPVPNLDYGPAQRAGPSPVVGSPRGQDGDGQETGVAHR